MLARFYPVLLALVAAIRQPIRTSDPFADVQAATRRHRRSHRCGAYTYADGSLPAALAAAIGARRTVEVGTALGYTALSVAHAAAKARVDTIEMDADHVRLAREQIAARGMADRVIVHHGAAEQVLPSLETAAYDFAFFDGFTPNAVVFSELRRLLREGGSLLAGNLILGPDRSVLDDLADARRWWTHAFGESALCVKRGAA
jgi:predicted O-methyltransferase YrrM